MSAIARLRRFWDSRRPTDEAAWDGDTSAWALSLTTHLGVLVVLTIIGIAAPRRDEFLVVLANVQQSEDPLLTTEEFNSVETSPEAIGSAAEGDADAMLALTPTLAETTSLPTEMEVDEPEQVTERIQIQEEIREATGPKFADSLLIKGVAGAGVSGAGGAIDRITQEILLSLEERKTLVVWLFDQSGSLERQRAEINKRFDRVYDELGVIEASGNPAFKQHDSKPLLTAVVAFGQTVSFPIAKPTDNVDEIKSAVAAIKTDDSGVEQTFRAVHDAAERFRAFRTQQPRRNVMFVIFTDEAGDDDAELDSTVAICRRFEIPVYCIGVPAPVRAARRAGEVRRSRSEIRPDAAVDARAARARVVPAGAGAYRVAGRRLHGLGLWAVFADAIVLRDGRHLLCRASQPARGARGQPP